MNAANQTIRLSLAAVLAFGVLIAPAQAEKKQISGTDTYGPLISNTTFYPGDVPDHEVRQYVHRDTTTSPDSDFDGSEVLVYVQSDSVAGTGSHRGYTIRTHKDGAKSFFAIEGTHKATSTDGGSEKVVWEGTWTGTGGTGKFENIKGTGTYSGQATPEGASTEWEGEIEY